MNIRHLVLWKLRHFPSSQHREEVLKLLRSQLEELPKVIPGILQFEIGISLVSSMASADLSLLSTFESPETLDAYLIHPRHREVIQLLAENTESKFISDYPIFPTSHLATSLDSCAKD